MARDEMELLYGELPDREVFDEAWQYQLFYGEDSDKGHQLVETQANDEVWARLNESSDRYTHALDHRADDENVEAIWAPAADILAALGFECDES